MQGVGVLLFVVVLCSFAPSSALAGLVSNATQDGPQLQFDDVDPAIRLSPRVAGSVLETESVHISLDTLYEVSLTDPTVTLPPPTLYGGAWTQVVDTKYNASQSFLFTAQLSFFTNDFHNESVLSGAFEMQFYLFDEDTEVTVGDGLLPFTVTPALAKFSLKVTDWPWDGKDDRGLLVRMNIAPRFNDSVRFNNTPQEGLTTFRLLGQHSNPKAVTQLRLVDAVELDGLVVQQDGVQFWIDRQQLVMRFGHFSSSLLYDPDVGVLLGRDDDGEGTSDNTALIVCLAVILPVAAGVVLIAGVAVAVSAYKRKQRFRLPRENSAVDLGEENYI